MVSKWWPFQYRGFYDVPRVVLISGPAFALLLDCQFDQALDDYRPEYDTYRLSTTTAEAPPDDWTLLTEDAERLGSIPVTEVEFDPTRRRMIRAAALDRIMSGDIPGP